jgi:hypothetical protein
MKPDYRILTRPAFILALVLLVLNDLWLKQTFGNWFTGKLSDFSGLFAFGTFLTACFPRHRKIALFCAAAFFTWWKSPFSGTFIFFCNEQIGLPIARVVDYTDLAALIVLPLCTLRLKDASSMGNAHRWAGKLVAIAAFISFCSTSLPYRSLYHYPANHVQYSKVFHSRKTKTEILDALRQKGLLLKTGHEKYFEANGSGELYFREKTGDSIRYTKAMNGLDSTLYARDSWTNGFYLVDRYPYDGNMLYNLTFTVDTSYERRFKSSIRVISFEADNGLRLELYKSKPMRKIKKHFESLFMAK